MDVKTVCLGMLTEGPASGYDLKKQFESSFAHFFAAGYGSIYPALASLAEQGLVDCEEIPQEGKPDRKVYCISDAGRQHLLEALRNTTPCHKIRSEFLAMLCFAHLMRPADVEAVVEHRLDEIGRYQELFAELSDCMGDWPAGMKFVLGFGKAITEAKEAYIKENRHLLTEEWDAKAATG
ncbi:MAG: PadR family transcriptional regulator [Gammaproteobacteria bacterium]|nr:PadR family transcriptional regulator [Gammaproteobacteria bacterium]NNF49356.1 PadR family transcriptional regulator [Woeseiaceae bacterium]MBT8093571.1 PadR family transcriptional regulator [Gammaproteobacteria bacterium]MBT8106465.1 PadR family transcriptional regulator [Gammaproteobacteria bacterium]NNK26480.1 PadR family transcriptional regulator [Woeseiaceae bacterium]